MSIDFITVYELFDNPSYAVKQTTLITLSNRANGKMDLMLKKAILFAKNTLCNDYQSSKCTGK